MKVYAVTLLQPQPDSYQKSCGFGFLANVRLRKVAYWNATMFPMSYHQSHGLNLCHLILQTYSFYSVSYLVMGSITEGQTTLGRTRPQ